MLADTEDLYYLYKTDVIETLQDCELEVMVQVFEKDYKRLPGELFLTNRNGSTL